MAADQQLELSLAAYRRGDWAESLKRAQQALALEPHSAAAMNNIGAAYGQMGDAAQAVAWEQKSLALDPHLEIARNNLQAYQAKLAQSHASPVASTVNGWVQRSLELNRAGRYTESREAAAEAVKLDPRSAEAWNNIAAAEEAMHHWDAAIEAAGKALAIRPDFQLARNNLTWSEEQKRLGVK
jgi:protein O-mannosyl-transferase